MIFVSLCLYLQTKRLDQQSKTEKKTFNIYDINQKSLTVEKLEAFKKVEYIEAVA